MLNVAMTVVVVPAVLAVWAKAVTLLVNAKEAVRLLATANLVGTTDVAARAAPVWRARRAMLQVSAKVVCRTVMVKRAVIMAAVEPVEPVQMGSSVTGPINVRRPAFLTARTKHVAAMVAEVPAEPVGLTSIVRLEPAKVMRAVVAA